MSYPAAAGFRDIGSSTMKYNPTIYSGKLLVKFYDATVAAAISNTDHEGEIKEMGQSVEIRSTPDIVIRPYKKGQNLINQQPESVAQTLDIDQGYYWSFVDNCVDEKQTDIKDHVNRWTTDASEQEKIVVDTEFLSFCVADASANNVGATAGVKTASFNMGATGAPLAITKGNVLEYIVDSGNVLDEQSAPETGRWLVIPPWMAGLIKKSDLKDASLAGDGTSIMRNGRLGMIDRYMLYSSNLLSSASDGGNTAFNMLFGTNDAITFAAQLTKNENLVNPFDFGMLYRGLLIYGRKVVKPEALGVLYGYKG